MLAFDLLRLRFAHRVLFRIDMTLISPPAVRVKLRDAKRAPAVFAASGRGVYTEYV